MSTVGKSTLSILLLPLLLLPISSAAAGDNLIGLFSDESGTECGAPYTVGTQLILHVIAVLESGIDDLTAVEFRIDNLPSSGSYPSGQIIGTWQTFLTIGTLDEGFTLAFNTPQTGSLVKLGQLAFMGWDSDWLSTDHRLMVVPSLDGEQLVIVDGDFATHDVEGGIFTFNCSSDEMCGCGGLMGPASWGRLKSLY